MGDHPQFQNIPDSAKQVAKWPLYWFENYCTQHMSKNEKLILIKISILNLKQQESRS